MIDKTLLIEEASARASYMATVATLGQNPKNAMGRKRLADALKRLNDAKDDVSAARADDD